MSLIVLDEQLAASEVLAPLRKHSRVQRLPELRPGEQIRDDRVPEILLTLKQPTFLTIDRHFWKQRLCNPGYCLLYFALSDEEQEVLPALLRSLLQRPEFASRARRMGKVARISTTWIACWQFSATKLERMAWRGISRRRGR